MTAHHACPANDGVADRLLAKEVTYEPQLTAPAQPRQ